MRWVCCASKGKKTVEGVHKKRFKGERLRGGGIAVGVFVS